MAVVIEVCERLMDHGPSGEPKFHAQIKREDGQEGGCPWGAGYSRLEAIGSLIDSHPEQFGIVIEDLKGKQAR